MAAQSSKKQYDTHYKRADEERPRNPHRWPSNFGGDKSTIGDVLEAYYAEHTHRRPASRYYVTETMNQFLAANALEENHPIGLLDKGHCKTYKAALLNGVNRRHRKAGPVTISRKLAALHHFVKWAVANDHMEHDIVAGLALPAKLVASARTHKEGFTDEELSRIFKALIPFRDYVDKSDQYNAKTKNEFAWIVLMLAHTGCRAMEIIQLLRSDVRQEDGVWYIDVVGQGEGRTLKNRASIRQVPLHSNMLKVGFLDWYKAQTDSRLFPCLYPYGGIKTTMTFTRLLKRLKLKRPELTLHSLRHTLTVKLERAEVHYSRMRRLLGHTIGKDVESRVYLGSLKYSVKELAEALEKVSFPTVA